MPNIVSVKVSGSLKKCIKLYLTKFSERESESIKVFCININLIIKLYTLTNIALILQIIVHDCYTLS